MRSIFASLVILLALAVAALGADGSDAVKNAVDGFDQKKKLSRKERMDLAKEEAKKYMELRRQGFDEVSHTKEAAAMRDYQLRKKKRKGLLRRRQADLASILFPGVSPENYMASEPMWAITDLVHSKKTQVPFEFYDLPGCLKPEGKSWMKSLKQRRNLGVRLQGNELMPAPFPMRITKNESCKPICKVSIGSKKVRWMRKLVEQQYRIQMTFDQLPVLMRSKELNYAVRGYPVGFKAPPSYTGLEEDEYYLYNHVKFTISYQEDPSNFEGIRITGFDVHPVSINHDLGSEKPGEFGGTSVISTCNGPSAAPVQNDPATYLRLRLGATGESMTVVFSYEVEWASSDLPWADRWDVYLIGSPDDDIHFFAIVNSLMIVLFLTGAIATIMIRTLRQDIAGYNEIQTLEEAQEETGWKLVHGDVFRPPTTFPLALCVMTGTGAQIGSAILLTMICAMVKLLNPMKKGATLTAILILYVLSGSVAGYVTSRMYKFCNATDWKLATIITAAALPGSMVSIFMVLNVFLTFAGAATAVSFLTILALFGMWMCISTPLVFVGSFFGFRSDRFYVPTKTNQIARFIPDLPWYSSPPISFLLGGVLPFGSVCIELFFIMSALWLHQIYYVMGFLLAVVLILAATCAEVAVVMTYLQLCVEDHRWWWKSYWNCAAAGFYLFLYSLWFLVSRLDLVGFLPVMVYLTYMSMISVCFGLFCGSVGVMTSFWFNTKIYGALKVD